MLEILQTSIKNRLRNTAGLACEQAHSCEFGENYFGGGASVIHPSSAHWRRCQNFPPNSRKLPRRQAKAGLAQLVELLTAEMVAPSPVEDVN